jgi:Family of unknown function (DUF5329)
MTACLAVNKQLITSGLVFAAFVTVIAIAPQRTATAAAANATAAGALPAAPASAVTQEVSALLDTVGSSECRFYRNGTWHTANQAKQHLRTKLDYMQKRGVIKSAEQFIELAATKSSVTGTRYKMACGSDNPQDAAAWLNSKLLVIRR